ncbi:hypothetical protein, partial [Rheinheimera baltica]
ATLDTGGQLHLTRQGLTPCKMHQALLDALTPGSPSKFLMAAFLLRSAKKVTAEICPVQPFVRAIFVLVPSFRLTM